jgi:hypothetical protein
MNLEQLTRELQEFLAGSTDAVVLEDDVVMGVRVVFRKLPGKASAADRTNCRIEEFTNLRIDEFSCAIKRTRQFVIPPIRQFRRVPLPFRD